MPLDCLSTLEQHDPELFDMIEREKRRQFRGLEMIASENLTSRAVFDCLGSPLTNKYSEGYPGARYYGGCEVIDEIETLCQQRALKAFGANPEEWAVNVQPYSGSPANMAVLCGLLEPHDRIMGLDLTHGGHLTHGYQTPTRKISMSGKFFESLSYGVTKDGLIDYDQVEDLATRFRPKLLICGYSAYSRDLDYARFRKIADSIGAMLMADVAHFSGFVCAKLLSDPFPYCDVVTSTTHKTLRGPRAGIVFARKMKDGKATGYDERINFACFPGLQGGPHQHQIAAVATQLKQVLEPGWVEYVTAMRSNARAFAEAIMKSGGKVISDGTDNHLVLWDCRPYGLTGSKLEKVLETINISVNKNTVPGDKSALSPGGIRVGTPALTTRGMGEAEMATIAAIYLKAKDIALQVQEKNGKALKVFNAAVDAGVPELVELRKEVEALATKFPMPGFDVNSMKYKE